MSAAHLPGPGGRWSSSPGAGRAPGADPAWDAVPAPEASTTAQPPRRPSVGAVEETLGEQRPLRASVVDVVVLAVLFLLALLGYQTVFGGPWYLVTGAMALVLSLLIALLGARWSLGPLLLTLAIAIVHFALGAAFVVPDRALLGVLPTPSALLELLRMPVTTWKSALTISPPIGIGNGVLGVVWLPMLLLGVGGFSVLLRTRRCVIAWLFPCAMMLCSIVFGTAESTLPLLRGLLFAMVSLAWLSWRFESARLRTSRSTIISDTVRAGSWDNPVLRRRVIGGGVILLLAAAITGAASPALDPPSGTARFAVRDSLTPQFDPREYVSPLSDFRGYVKHRRKEELFTVTNVKDGEKVRLATLDDYNREVYDVAGSSRADSPSGAFLKIAGAVDLAQPGADARTSTVTIGGYHGVWMPTLGASTDRVDPDQEQTAQRPSGSARLGDSLFLNRRSQTLVDASSLREGDSYQATYEPYTAASEEDQHSMRFADGVADELPPVDGLDPKFKQAAEEWAGDEPTDYATMNNLLLGIKNEAEYSHGIEDEQASLSGHGEARLLAMLNDPSFDRSEADAMPQGRIGDEEQFAALTAVLAREIGIPARVVMGFEVSGSESGTATVTGDDVTAWVEVAFQEPGSDRIHWERFDPAPDNDDTLTQPEQKTTDKPQPQVPQPPPPPADPPTPPPGATADDQPDPPDPPEPAPLWVGYASGTGLLAVLVAATLGAIAGAKAMRRRHRRLRGAPADRIDGGWREIVDLRTDLGRRTPPSDTRKETAEAIIAEAATAAESASGTVGGAAAGDGSDTETAEDLRRLAAGADRATFAPDAPTEPDLESYWASVMAARRRMTEHLPWHRRARAAVSLRSFRARRRADRRAQQRLRAASAQRSADDARRGSVADHDARAGVGASLRGALEGGTRSIRSLVDRAADRYRAWRRTSSARRGSRRRRDR